MPPLVRLYIRQVITGFGLSAIFVAPLLYFDVANLWHLVRSTSGGGVAVVMLVVFNGIVFAGVQFAIAVMGLAEGGGPGGGRRQRRPLPAPVTRPVTVPVTRPADGR
ncbi:hypothetical protein [Shimia sp.]|uniref:hypothetical protein n=1 Tax=Shimia sp. TaxID=1954381 RepID=UPI0035692BB4